MWRRWGLALFVLGVAAAATTALWLWPQPRFSRTVRSFIKVDAPTVSLTNVRIIDGTGAPARERQIITIQNGRIAQVGDMNHLRPPDGSTVLDLTGRTVMPGLVMVHEHLFYPIGQERFGLFGGSFSRLYLAGGVTTMRTGGSLNGRADLDVKQLIERGREAGPTIDATAPYLHGTGPDEMRRQVAHWADEGATSFKAYVNIRRDELAAAIDEAHKRGLKITGHLCSVTYAEAADLGIDNLEHGFVVATDFVGDKQPDVCPGEDRAREVVARLDEHGDAFTRLVKKLIDRHVALTSTLPVFETFTPGRPVPRGLDMLVPPLREEFLRQYARIAASPQSFYATLFPNAIALERAFVNAGGLLMAGTDPTGVGGVIPGMPTSDSSNSWLKAGSRRSKRSPLPRGMAPRTSDATRRSARLPSANRPISSSCAAIRRCRYAMCGTSRSCSGRASGSIRRR
jgi:hypothetical protein